MYAHQLYPPTKIAPPIVLPSVIGSKDFQKKAPMERGPPSIMLINERYMYSTVWGNRVVVDMRNGRYSPIDLETPS